MTNFDEQIASAKSDIESEDKAMAKCRAEAVEVIANWLKDWFWTKAEEIVKTEADITIALGNNRLGELKKKVRKLQERTNKLVDQHVGAEEVWYGWRKPERNFNSIVNLESNLTKAIQSVMGQLGSILTEFGYQKGTNVWVDDGRPTFRMGFKVPAQFSDTIKQFRKHGDCWIKYQRQIEELQRTKAQQAAAERWDSA